MASAPRATYALQLLIEVLSDDGYLQVVKAQPPDGCVLRDIVGNTYGVSIRQLKEDGDGVAAP